MYTQPTAWPTRAAASALHRNEQSHDAAAPPAWLTNVLLVLASGVLLALAGASAWLSYHAQVAYVLAHNGNQTAEAKVWALLLDAGTAGVSLLRLYETLRRRPGAATRISLIGCIAASVTLNMLHTPSRTPGGFLVAAVPPLMYAAFLEHLLVNLRSLLTGEEERRRPLHTIALWINFPSLMWSSRRGLLRRAAEGALLEPDRAATEADVDGTPCATVAEVEDPEQLQSSSGHGASIHSPVRRSRRGRGPGPKRVAFESALAQQIRSGDLRLFSDDERERNAAAYQAAASLPAPLSRGTARRYVVQALPRLEVIGAFGALPVDNAVSGPGA